MIWVLKMYWTQSLTTLSFFYQLRTVVKLWFSHSCSAHCENYGISYYNINFYWVDLMGSWLSEIWSCGHESLSPVSVLPPQCKSGHSCRVYTGYWYTILDPLRKGSVSFILDLADQHWVVRRVHLDLKTTLKFLPIYLMTSLIPCSHVHRKSPPVTLSFFLLFIMPARICCFLWGQDRHLHRRINPGA